MESVLDGTERLHALTVYRTGLVRFGDPGVGVNKGSQSGPWSEGLRHLHRVRTLLPRHQTHLRSGEALALEQHWEHRPENKTWRPGLRRGVGFRPEKKEGPEAWQPRLNRTHLPGMLPAPPLPQHPTSNSKAILVTC